MASTLNIRTRARTFPTRNLLDLLHILQPSQDLVPTRDPLGRRTPVPCRCGSAPTTHRFAEYVSIVRPRPTCAIVKLMDRTVRWSAVGNQPKDDWEGSTAEERLIAVETIREQYRQLHGQHEWRLQRFFEIVDRASGEVLARGGPGTRRPRST